MSRRWGRRRDKVGRRRRGGVCVVVRLIVVTASIRAPQRVRTPSSCRVRALVASEKRRWVTRVEARSGLASLLVPGGSVPSGGACSVGFLCFWHGKARLYLHKKKKGSTRSLNSALCPERRSTDWLHVPLHALIDIEQVLLRFILVSN